MSALDILYENAAESAEVKWEIEDIKFTLKNGSNLYAEVNTKFSNWKDVKETIHTIYEQCINKCTSVYIYTNYGEVVFNNIPRSYIPFETFIINTLYYNALGEYQFIMRDSIVDSIREDYCKSTLNLFKNCLSQYKQFEVILDDSKVLYYVHRLSSIAEILMIAVPFVKPILNDNNHTVKLRMAEHDDCERRFSDVHSFLEAITDITEFFIHKDDKLYKRLKEKDYPEYVLNLFK